METFQKISDMVIAGKKQIGTELNKYPSVNFNMTNLVPDFSELASAIDTLTDDATAESNMILKDYTAYVKGNKIKGTIPSKEAAAYTPGRSDQTIAAGQYLSGAQTIKGDQNLTAANIISGKTIFGVQGSAQAESHTIEANKSVNITSTSGSITPSTGNNAMSAVTYSISGVDASKIISGQSILGVAGSAEQESHTEMSRSFSQSEMASADVTIEAGQGITIPANQYLTNSLTINSRNSLHPKLYRASVNMAKGDGNSITIGNGGIQRITHLWMDSQKCNVVCASPTLSCKLNDDGTVTINVKCAATNSNYTVYIYLLALESSNSTNSDGTTYTKTASGTMTKDTTNSFDFTDDNNKTIKSVVEFTAAMNNSQNRSSNPELEFWIDGSTIYSTLYESSDGNPGYNITVKYTV